MKLVGAAGDVLAADEGGAVVGDYVIQHGVWAPASTRMFHAIISDTCALATGEFCFFFAISITFC